ncbi:MAG TPA: hypothetical protein DHW78_08615 [Ruminococcaceae bacterium]|nr:hypothetical protein [Oscillospiraceae bacterium]HCM24368.1 hypothetical protein [Oscillospiraceae bacterium]
MTVLKVNYPIILYAYGPKTKVCFINEESCLMRSALYLSVLKITWVTEKPSGIPIWSQALFPKAIVMVK